MASNAPASYFTFNGTNQYIVIPRSIQDDFTIEFKFKSTAGRGYYSDWWQGSGLIDGECAGFVNDFGTSLNANGQVMAGGGLTSSGSKTIKSQSGLNNGVWYHVAYTRVKATGLMTLYIDGVSVATGTGATASYTSPPRLTIGCIQVLNNYFNGSIGDIRFWNVARSAADILNNKDLILTGAESGLVALYKYINGTMLLDSTSNGNNGTIYNNPTFTGEVATPPVINVLSHSTNLLSDTFELSKCNVIFTTNVNLIEWVARAGGTGPNSGLLVGSGGAVAANANVSFDVEFAELTEGDKDYKISVYGKNGAGIWNNYEA